MVWTIEISKTAVKQLKKLDKPTQKRILKFLNEKIDQQDNPMSHGKALKGNKSDLWRYRVGDYRIICHFEKEKYVVLALAIGHRKSIYKT